MQEEKAADEKLTEVTPPILNEALLAGVDDAVEAEAELEEV